MSVVWVLEKPKTKRPSIARSLQGDFPVRVIASWRSFVRLSHVYPSKTPDAVLVNLQPSVYRIDPADKYINENYPGALRIFLGAADKIPLMQKAGRFVLDWATDPFKLSILLKNLIEMRGCSSRNILYKDLIFDQDELVITHSFSSTSEQLTLKESQLLKFLIKNAGECVGRSHLLEAIWPGMKVSPRTLDSQISRLRRRLEPMAVSIESVYGGGYIFR